MSALAKQAGRWQHAQRATLVCVCRVQPTTAAGSVHSPAAPSPQLGFQHKQASFLQRKASSRAAGVTISATTTQQAPVTSSHAEESQTVFEFACPICQQTTFRCKSQPAGGAGLDCPRCARTFQPSKDGAFLDLTLTSGATPRVYEQPTWAGTEIFRSPLVSFVYERGWRQGFAWAGFPGVDEEYELAMSFLRQAGTRRDADGTAHGRSGKKRVLVDMSCGSGLFTRKFAQSGEFGGVIAADFSESMLRQAKAFYEEGSNGSSSGSRARGSSNSNGSTTPVVFLRADVGRLPFATGSVDAIHAGAAIHCWPNPQAAMAEISRVLAPGGVFVASTFLAAAAPLGQLLGNDDLVRPLNQIDIRSRTTAYRWWEETELRDLVDQVGLQDYARERRWRFIMFSARKPDGKQHFNTTTTGNGNSSGSSTGANGTNATEDHASAPAPPATASAGAGAPPTVTDLGASAAAAATAAASAVSEASYTATEVVSEAVLSATGAVSDMALAASNAVSEAALAAGEAVSQAATSVGDAASDAAVTRGSAVAEAATSTGEKVSEGAVSASQAVSEGRPVTSSVNGSSSTSNSSASTSEAKAADPAAASAPSSSASAGSKPASPEPRASASAGRADAGKDDADSGAAEASDDSE